MHLNRLAPSQARLTFTAELTIGESEFDLYPFVKPLGWTMPNKNSLRFRVADLEQLVAEIRAMRQLLADANVSLLAVQIRETIFDTNCGDEL